MKAGGAGVHEHRVDDPLMDIPLLRTHRNYLGATISQGVGGLAEMGLGVIFPLLLILNLGMDPALAGLALIPTTVPMIVISPLAGRWYDRSGGRPPLVTGSRSTLDNRSYVNHPNAEAPAQVGLQRSARASEPRRRSRRALSRS